VFSPVLVCPYGSILLVFRLNVFVSKNARMLECENARMLTTVVILAFLHSRILALKKIETKPIRKSRTHI